MRNSFSSPPTTRLSLSPRRPRSRLPPRWLLPQRTHARFARHKRERRKTLAPFYLHLSFENMAKRFRVSTTGPGAFVSRVTRAFVNGAKRRFVFARSAKPSAPKRPAAATTKADGAARRRPRTRPAGDAKSVPASRRATKALRPTLDLQDALPPIYPRLFLPCQALAEGNQGFTDKRQWTADKGLFELECQGEEWNVSLHAPPPTPTSNSSKHLLPIAYKMRILCGILFRLPFSQNPCESMKSVAKRPSPRQVENSSEGRSSFVFRRAAQPLSRPAHAGFRERRAAPFHVRAKRPARCPQAACGRDHESRRRRAPPATNAPCGRREIRPRLPSSHESAPPHPRPSGCPHAHLPKALFAVSSAYQG